MKYADTWTRGPLNTECKQLIVAVDHGLSFPNMVGLEDPMRITRNLALTPEVDGIIASPGVYKQAEKYGIDLSKMNRLITVDHVTTSGNELMERRMIITPEDAMEYRPDCYKMFLNMYEDKKLLFDNLEDISRYAVCARKNGISCLAEIMFWNNPEYDKAEDKLPFLREGCRLAMEAGADILKISYVASPESINQMIGEIALPTFILGGAKNNDRESFIASVREMASMDICGLMFGRNVWQSDCIERTIKDLRAALDSKER